MKIKDVEKLTGLTAKSIRFYEAKGLLEVGRNEENSYREYTEENVKQLRRIKLFRYLDFSIEELQQMKTWDVETVKKSLSSKAAEYSVQMADVEQKRDLCLSLYKDYGKNTEEVVEEYHEAIDFIEGEEFQELRNELERFACPSISEMVVWTLVFLGPILSLFINLEIQQYKALWLNIPLALGATVWLTLKWRDFFRQRKYNKKAVKEKNQQTKFVIPIMLVGIILSILALIGVLILQQEWMAPEGWLFFETDPRLMWLMMGTIVVPILMVLAWAADFLDRSGKWEGGKYAFDWAVELRKRTPIVIVVWAVCAYICFTSVTFVTADQIIRHSPIYPLGTSYEYNAVEKVDARFGTKLFSIFDHERKGSFSYTIWLDGKKTIFTGGSSNEEIPRYEDTYLELEEFDQALMALGIPKTGDASTSDRCDMDKRYVDRLVRITERGK